jgi:hypothetical protein
MNGSRYGGARKPLSWIMEGNCIRCLSHSLNTNGYPQRRAKPQTFCRLILFRRYGEFPSHIVARHLCDNKWCINPDHIVPGTHIENAQDSIRFGKLPFGEQKTQSKLKNKQVVVIRKMIADRLPQYVIAKRFRVSPSLISKIATNKNWKKV